MKRRTFLEKAISVSALAAMTPASLLRCKTQTEVNRHKILNAYYFRAHMYTMVPRQVREDLQWMADLGTQVVSIAVIEQDLFAAVENIEIICNEAEKVGIKVYAVPSRWGGLFAGAPKVPSLFSVKNSQTWVLKENGKPLISRVSGVISSIHYPETLEFFKKSIDKVFKLWNIKGIIWDEPKFFNEDFSPKAIETLGRNAPRSAHVKAAVNFLSNINGYVKNNYPEMNTCLFAYANIKDDVVEAAARTKGLDTFGCDGRPWSVNDGGVAESSQKVLLGPGERFLKAARKNNKNTLWLIENHNMRNEDVEIMDKRLPEVIKKDVDHLIYYYYPRNLEDPDRNMGVIKKHLMNWGK